MRFISTRGQSAAASAPEAVLRGLAPDGGLYLPDTLPRLDWAALPEAYPALAAAVFQALLPGFAAGALSDIATQAYTHRFDSPRVAPVRPLEDAFVLELFHGPTAAFKDLALSALPRLMTSARDALMPGTRILVLTATSGDTGGAAMAGFAGLPDTRALVYYPEEGISPVQKAQMRRMPGDNLRAFGIRGDFDRAQSGVKAVFAKAQAEGLPERLLLSSANSINIGRLVPQVVYYISAYQDLVRRGALRPGESLHVVVPSGNFGDILAAFLAKAMGLPLGRLVCASNQNRVLTDFLATGHYDARRALRLSISPSMDILVSSNVERLLFYATGGDRGHVARLMRQLKEQGHYQLTGAPLSHVQEHFMATSATEADTRAAIRQVWQQAGYLMDPHAAVAWHGYQQIKAQLPPGKALILATASPFKFTGAVLNALGMPQDKDDVMGLRSLSRHTGLPLPSSLSWLEGAGDLRGQVIEPEAIANTAFQEASQW